MNQQGRTIIELLSVVAIIGLVSSYAVNPLSNAHSRSQATSSINWIIGAVNYARHAAIVKNTTITLCPVSKTELKCSGDWNQGLIVFTDFNENARIDGNDYVLQKISANNVHGTLKWRAFRNRQYLQMTGVGITRYQNGNFTYCPEDKDLRFAKQIVINVQGRVRSVHSKNKQGLAIDRKRKLLRC